MKKVVKVFITLTFLGGLVTTGSCNFISAETKVEITKIETHNDKWLAMERELHSPKFQLNLKNMTCQEIENFLLKYDGAQADVYVIDSNVSTSKKATPASHVTENLINGGINDYADSKTGLANMRDYLEANAAAFAVGTVIGGATGVLGGFVIAAGSGLMATRCTEGYNDAKSWINVGSSKGGVRMTLSAEFPIKSASSTTQVKISKL